MQNILFNGVPRSLIERHLPVLLRHEYRAGDVIFDEYSKGRDLHLICTGRVRIKKYTKFGVESLLAVLHPGDFFGELSVIDSLPRSARAEAMDECLVVSLSPETFRQLLQENTTFDVNVMSNLAVRLRTMDQTFVLELGRGVLAVKSQMDRMNKLIEASKIVNSTLDIDALLVLILN